MSEVLRRNQERIAQAIAAERGDDLVADTEVSLDSEGKKSIYQAGLTAAFEHAKPMLIEVLTACKQLLEQGTDPAEVRALVLEMVQKTEVNHRFTKLDDNYRVTRPNNGQAADQIMKCLREGESVEHALKCVYTEVYWITQPDDDVPPPSNGEGDVPSSLDDSSQDPFDDVLPEPADDYVAQLESYLSFLSEQFAQRVDEVEIDGETVLVPRPEFVRLRKARSNGVWLLSYDSILGEEKNPWRGPEGDKYQAQFDVPVQDQELAEATNPDDLDAIAQLIRESVPRHGSRKDQPGKPKNYYLMTREDNEELKQDIANLLELDHSSSLLGWLRSELIKGADASDLRAMLAEQQLKWAERDAERDALPKENLTALRPVRPSADVVPEVTVAAVAIDVSERDRKVRSIKAFIRSEVEGLTREEAMARKVDILENAKILL